MRKGAPLIELNWFLSERERSVGALKVQGLEMTDVSGSQDLGFGVCVVCV